MKIYLTPFDFDTPDPNNPSHAQIGIGSQLPSQFILKLHTIKLRAEDSKALVTLAHNSFENIDCGVDQEDASFPYWHNMTRVLIEASLLKLITCWNSKSNKDDTTLIESGHPSLSVRNSEKKKELEYLIEIRNKVAHPDFMIGNPVNAITVSDSIIRLIADLSAFTIERLEEIEAEQSELRMKRGEIKS